MMALALAADPDAAFVAALADAAPGLAGLARRMAGDDADDVMQEAFLRAWRRRAAVREGVGGWFRAIVVRECLRVLRRRALRRWLPFPETDRPSPAPGPDVGVDAARARAAAEGLPPQQRLVWGLRFDEGFSVPEIAQTTGLSPETVRTHLGRALAAVQRRLELPDV
jgi:RNA polymerase sigma-70 factor (ECF subfamily)